MNPIAKISLLLPFTFCLSFLPLLNAQNQTGSDDLIAQTCKQTRHESLCVSSLNAQEASHGADLVGLALFAIKAAATNGSDTSVQIKKLLNDTTLDPFVQQCLDDCSEHYLSAVEQLQDSIAALLAKAYKDVNTWVQAALIDADSCEDGFKRYPGHESVLTKRNQIFSQLCDIVLDITNILEKK